LLVIVPTGLLLNYFGLAVASQLKNVIYLDMTGTAFVSLLLGPWWGAITGLLSNSFVNWALNPDPDPELHIFPWSLVNVTGALFWGWMAQKVSFRNYLISYHRTWSDDITFLMVFGVGGAGVMSVIGTSIKLALGPQNLAIDPHFAEAVNDLL